MEEIKAKKSIKQKCIIAFLCLALIPLAIAGVYGNYYCINLLEDASIHHFESKLGSRAKEIERFVENASKDLLFLSHSNSLNDLVEFKGQSSSQGFNHLRKRLENEFLAFSRTRQHYYQIIYINEKGIEIARVDSDGEHSSAIPLDRLQNKGKRPYFTESMRYSDGQIYVSKMDINMEHGKFEPGNKKVLRFSTPLFGSADRKKRILITNLYGEHLIRQLKSIHVTNEGAIFLVNEEGSYISSLNHKGDKIRALSPDLVIDLNRDFPAIQGQ